MDAFGKWKVWEAAGFLPCVRVQVSLSQQVPILDDLSRSQLKCWEWEEMTPVREGGSYRRKDREW